MGKKQEPQIKASKDNYTCITFYPDLAKFGMTHLEDDTVALMRKRVFDVAGVLTDKVNKTACKVGNFMHLKCMLPDDIMS
jgi:hypothetical protein